MKVFGVDFTSVPSQSKPIMLSVCELVGDELVVHELRPIKSFDAFADFLRASGPWIAGMDFPFGQPRRLIQNLGWAGAWEAYVSQVGRLSRSSFREVLEAYRRDRPAGDREHFRLTDVLASSQSPSKLYGVPAALMFYEGAPRLAASDASIVPVRETESNKVIVEAYPALVARALVGAEKYKSGEDADAQQRAVEVRRQMVQRLTSGILARYGLRVRLPEETKAACISDWQGDSIDSVFAAIQAAWSWRRRDFGFGIPDDCDRAEGWIVDPLIQPSVNSSITRVRPVFQRLFQSDRTGASWLPQLLMLSPSTAITDAVRSAPGTLLNVNLEKRTYPDRVLGPIELERCFEYSVAPSKRFLQWLIKHPQRIMWPGAPNSLRTYGKETQKWREQLVGKHGEATQAAAVLSAMTSLANLGVEKSSKQWWAFEGFTEVDCFLETDRLVILVEGKRTESLSESTDWYRGRNQLHRNLEAARDLAGGREFGVMILSEEPVSGASLGKSDDGLPHLEPEERAELMRHYLGCITWQQVCEATGQDYRSLPNRIARRMRRSAHD